LAPTRGVSPADEDAESELEKHENENDKHGCDENENRQSAHAALHPPMKASTSFHGVNMKSTAAMRMMTIISLIL
jgi:hypothetical protein